MPPNLDAISWIHFLNYLLDLKKYSNKYANSCKIIYFCNKVYNFAPTSVKLQLGFVWHENRCIRMISFEEKDLHAFEVRAPPSGSSYRPATFLQRPRPSNIPTCMCTCNTHSAQQWSINKQGSHEPRLITRDRWIGSSRVDVKLSLSPSHTHRGT